MRCLFCGKELPLFKRLTGGEFCSDTHRQQYQQEYSQLALTRLLQAQPPEDGKKQEDRPAPVRAASPVKPALTDKKASAAPQVATAQQAPTVKPAPGAGPIAAGKTYPLQAPSPAASPAVSLARNGAPRSPYTAAAVAEPRAAKAATTTHPEPMAPAGIAGLIKYRPAAAASKGAVPAIAKAEPATSLHRMIPQIDSAPPGVRLESSDRLAYDAIAKPPGLPWRPRHDRLEVRDFTRPAPILDLGAKLAEPWVETATEPVELSFTATLSRAETTPWMQPHREFAAGRLQAGGLAAFDLATTGFEISTAAQPIMLPVESSPAEEAPLPQSAPSRRFMPAAPATSTTPATPAARDAEPVTQPMPIVVVGIPGGRAKPVQIFASTLRPAGAARMPRYDSLPLRPAMVVGRADAPSKKAEPVKIEPAGPAVKTTSAEIPSAPPVEPLAANPATRKAATSPPSAPASAAPATSPVEMPAASLIEAPAAKSPAPANARPADSNRWATKTSAAGTPATLVRPAAAERKLGTERKASRELPEPGREQAEVAWEQTKLNREQAELNRKQADLNRQQAELIREQAKAAPKADASASPAAPQSPPAPAALKRVEMAPTPPAASASPATPSPVSAGPAAPASDAAPGTAKSSLSLNARPAELEKNDLGLPKLDLKKAKRRARLGGQIAATAAACVPLLAGGIWFYANRTGGFETAAISSLTVGAGPEWIENFSPDGKHPRTISVLRASAGWSDYTIEFAGSVDVKALGWVFRARDPGDFYVGRIEQEKTLGGAAAAFVYFPVIGGVPQERKRSPVALPAAPGTVYKIRFEASGERFTAWIQDRKIEEWSDGRLPSGGAGLYSESGERALLQGDFRVVPRTAASK